MDRCQSILLQNHELISLNNLKITKTATNQHTAYIFEAVQKQYQLHDLKIMSKFDIGAILQNIHIKNEKATNQQRIIVITLICEQYAKSIPNSMINYGLKNNTQVAATKNIYTNIDVVTIQYNKRSDRNRVFKFICKMLQCNKMAAVMQGCEIKFNYPTKAVQHSQKQTKDKYTLITGGSRGIGAKIAIQLAKQGRNVIITGRPGNKQVAQFAISLQTQYKIKTNSLYLDVKDEKSCSSLAKKISQMNITVDNIIFNGAVGQKTCQEQATQTVTKQQILIQVNAIGQVQLYEKLQQYKLLNKNTLMMIVSSVIGYRPFKQMNLSYGCAKYMLQGWIEKIKDKYNTMIIYPGGTDTDMFAKSTLNRLKEINKIDQFVGKLPKKFVIPPEIIASIVGLYIDDEFKDYLNGAKILACCGMQLEFNDWPAVSL